MNLADLVDDKGLQQDEWSLTAPAFGEEGQLRVVGWSGKNISAKYYILRCNACSQDIELFGEGYFRSLKSSLIKGQVPCGCSSKPKWSKEQFSTLCQRSADNIDYTFLGFAGEWKGKNTKIKMFCEKHGEWGSTTICNLINRGNGCPRCAELLSTKSDDIMVQSFLASGAFHPDTKFWRSDRTNRKGCKVYWHIFCPDCKQPGESFSGGLQRGSRSCACNMHRQQECYINWLVDEYNNSVAIKFGIANNSKQRIKQQDSKCIYTLKQHSVYQFPAVAACKKAERDCKQELECGIVLRRDMQDGYTETTWIYNLEKIIEIYQRNGGVRIE